MLNMNKEEIKQEQNKGLIARILGGTPTILQKVFFILMAFSLILWPLGCYVSIFFFDAPVRSDVDKICRYGMLITILTMPTTHILKQHINALHYNSLPIQKGT